MESKSRKVKHGKTQNETLDFFRRVLKYKNHTHMKGTSCFEKGDCGPENL